MLGVDKTYQAPPNSGQVVLGHTLPSLLDQACDRAPNTQAFNQFTDAGWQPLSNQAFRATAEAIALGLLNLGLERGDRVALLMHSDVQFCLVDMGCLLATLVNVPIDLTQTLEQIIFVLQHSEAKALVISNLDLLTQLEPYLWDTPALKYAIVAEVSADWPQARSQQTLTQSISSSNEKLPLNTTEIPESACLTIPTLLHPARSDHPDSPIPPCIRLVSLAEVESSGQTQISDTQQLRASLAPDQLATIVYIPDDTGQLQGVMLTHENLSANAIAPFRVSLVCSAATRKLCSPFYRSTMCWRVRCSMDTCTMGTASIFQPRIG